MPASGRMLCGPTSNLVIFLLPLQPVLISSDHCRFPEKATSSGAPHLPHLHLHLASSSLSDMQSIKSLRGSGNGNTVDGTKQTNIGNLRQLLFRRRALYLEASWENCNDIQGNAYA